MIQCKDKKGGKIILPSAHRDSSIELFRIITMMCIIAHHYVVNSGILGEITRENVMTGNSLFSLIFGWGGKTGINCFVLITGYFMCKTNISIKKYLKLYFEIVFYAIMFNLIFIFSGYKSFSMLEFIKLVVPIYDIGKEFVGSYLIFYLFIPYLNILIKAMDEVHHIILILICLLCGVILQTFLRAPAAFTYVGWFMVLYFIAAYIRLYPKGLFECKKKCAVLAIISLLLSWGSIVVNAWIYAKWGIGVDLYRFVHINRIMAVLTAITAFLFFKNIHLKYHPVINKFAASTFGVLLIHANSDTMRQWLWQDMLNNVGAYHSSFLVPHAIVSVICIYAICALIDMARIQLLEKPFFGWLEGWLAKGQDILDHIWSI